jgi:pimeloyl-ACP methyl ester carboxylesterase
MKKIAFDETKLTENTSLDLINNLQFSDILTPLSFNPIETAYVRQQKDNIPIVLIHGFDSSLLEFRRLFPLLSLHHPTFAIDLLGFGFTTRSPDVPISPASIKTHLYYCWKTLIQQPMILVGASMGGAVAIDFALSHPELVKKLVLIDSAGLARQPFASKLMFSPLDRWATNFLALPKVRKSVSIAAYYDKSFVSDDAEACASLHLQCPGWSESLISFTKSGGYGSFVKNLSDLYQPSLIIWGKNDTILGTKSATQFEKLLPNNQLIWIPDCGHVPHLEKSQKTADIILDFIQH